jgi:hypothetical protein
MREPAARAQAAARPLPVELKISGRWTRREGASPPRAARRLLVSPACPPRPLESRINSPPLLYPSSLSLFLSLAGNGSRLCLSCTSSRRLDSRRCQLESRRRRPESCLLRLESRLLNLDSSLLHLDSPFPNVWRRLCCWSAASPRYCIRLCFLART